MLKRKIHPVGSTPPEVADPFTWFFAHAGEPANLTQVPIDFEQYWIIDYLRSLRARNGFRAVRFGHYQDYEDFMVYRPTSELSWLDVSLDRGAKIDAALKAYEDLPAGKPPMQVCRAHPIDLALFTFVGSIDARHPVRTGNGARLALKHQGLYEDDLTDEVTQVNTHATAHGIDAVFQLEEPHVLYALNKMPPALRPAAARWLAERTARVLALLPPGRAYLHLCYGRLGGKEAVAPRNMTPVVLYLNALSRRLARSAQTLPPVHIPAAYGQHPPPIEDDYYAPLTQLDAAWEIIAGVAGPGMATQSHTALKLMETHAGRQALAVTSRCGMGDYTEPQAADTMRLCLELADS